MTGAVGLGVHDLTRGIGHLGDRGEHAVFPGHGYDAAVPAQRVQLGGDPPAVFVELGAQGVEGFADVEGVEPAALRSEERRVGKECRDRWWRGGGRGAWGEETDIT